MDGIISSKTLFYFEELDDDEEEDDDVWDTLPSKLPPSSS